MHNIEEKVTQLTGLYSDDKHILLDSDEGVNMESTEKNTELILEYEEKVDNPQAEYISKDEWVEETKEEVTDEEIQEIIDEPIFKEEKLVCKHQNILQDEGNASFIDDYKIEQMQKGDKGNKPIYINVLEGDLHKNLGRNEQPLFEFENMVHPNEEVKHSSVMYDKEFELLQSHTHAKPLMSEPDKKGITSKVTSINTDELIKGPNVEVNEVVVEEIVDRHVVNEVPHSTQNNIEDEHIIEIGVNKGMKHINKKKKNHLKKSMYCHQCGKLYKDMPRHIVTHTKEKDSRCHMCNMTFGLRFNLTRHIKAIHEQYLEYFHCSKCTRQFTTKINLNNHELKHNTVFPKVGVVPSKTTLREALTCVTCAKTVKGKTELKYHTRIHNGKKLQCNMCDLEYTNPRGLKRHLEVKHLVFQVNTLTCDLCHQEFKSRGKLVRHRRENHFIKEQTFRCTQFECDKSYSIQKDLDDHINIIHLKVKAFKCKVCKKDFGRKSSHTLQVQGAHTKERKFKCTGCPQAYKEKRNMLNHERKTHLNRRTFLLFCCCFLIIN